MSTLYPNEGREQPLQPPDHSGCHCVACQDEWADLVEPAPVMCQRCHAQPPADGADECDPCLKAIQDEEVSEANRALVARFDAAVAA